MPQFTVIFQTGGSYLVSAADKYDAIEKAKEKHYSKGKIGVREVRDANGKKVL